jgi:hypothetical protein
MKWNRIADVAKKTLDSRGGTEGLKRDADRLRDIATGPGTPKEKAKRAADALKQQEQQHEHPPQSPPPPPQ